MKKEKKAQIRVTTSVLLCKSTTGVPFDRVFDSTYNKSRSMQVFYKYYDETGNVP